MHVHVHVTHSCEGVQNPYFRFGMQGGHLHRYVHVHVYICIYVHMYFTCCSIASSCVCVHAQSEDTAVDRTAKYHTLKPDTLTELVYPVVSGSKRFHCTHMYIQCTCMHVHVHTMYIYACKYNVHVCTCACIRNIYGDGATLGVYLTGHVVKVFCTVFLVVCDCFLCTSLRTVRHQYYHHFWEKLPVH